MKEIQATVRVAEENGNLPSLDKKGRGVCEEAGGSRAAGRAASFSLEVLETRERHLCFMHPAGPDQRRQGKGFLHPMLRTKQQKLLGTERRWINMTRYLIHNLVH